MRHTVLAVIGLLLSSYGPVPFAQDGSGDPVRFNRDIRPILAANCFQCHGPDPAAREADLRLDREEGYFAAREGAPTVVRGNPEGSLLFKRVTSSNPKKLMPPPSSKKALKPEEKALIRRWIAEGAPWEPHWSFIKPVRPALPAVRNGGWVRNEIDRFVLARLEAEGLSPAPEADRRSLARRVSLDLTGLPPEPAAVDAFVSDSAPDAYEKLVDRLLKSPRYGEHRARYWLDAARYADTHGLHFDNFRDIWPYRDWVIGAFNRNLPFDRFTVEQIAGDLLPGATDDQRIASGFHRCAMTTNEGGTIAEENLANYARERVETTSWVWLGLTANCAVCHEHKFDPISMKDFYSMSAFFRNTTQRDKDGNIRDTPPVLMLPQGKDKARWSAIPGEIAALRKAEAGRRKAVHGEIEKWLAGLTIKDWEASLPKPDFHETLEGKTVDGNQPIEIGNDVGGFDRDTAFSYGCRIRVPKNFSGSSAVFARMDDQAAYRGWDLWLQDREFAAHLVHRWPDDAIKVVTRGRRLKPGTWQHVFVTYDGSGKAKGFRIYVDGKEAPLRFEADKLKSTTKTDTPMLIGRRRTSSPLLGAELRDIRLYDHRLSEGEVGALAFDHAARRVLSREVQDRKGKELKALIQAKAGLDPELTRVRNGISELEEEQKAIRGRSPVGYVMEEKKGSMPMARILFRGEYDKPRDKVQANVFGALHSLPEGAPRNRLGLGRWLVSPENPLTPRVIVNRFWQEVFGTGIVKTSEDFGIMGASPSHPGLLDWLAVEFRDGGWNVKALFRRIVLSATYRQSAAVTPEKLGKDRENRLLSRGPRFRMDAEMVRDHALAASGLLSDKIGGPSVKPYQPSGVWSAVAMPESNTRFYKADQGEGLYRRSLYTFWKRAAPPASMEILNAPSREVSCLRRERTNTPLQALVTLNDPQFVESARKLAEMTLKSGGRRGRDRIGFLYRRVLSRSPRAEEVGIVSRIVEKLRSHYEGHPEDARKLLKVGAAKTDPKLDPKVLATWTMTANQLLNLDETLNK